MVVLMELPQAILLLLMVVMAVLVLAVEAVDVEPILV
jgi:hypothetical protein